MTIQEVMSLPHLVYSQIEIIKEKELLHIHTEEGFKATTFKEGDDIKDYSSFICMYSPLLEEYPEYRIITLEQDNEYSNERTIALEEERLLKQERRKQEMEAAYKEGLKKIEEENEK